MNTTLTGNPKEFWEGEHNFLTIADEYANKDYKSIRKFVLKNGDEVPKCKPKLYALTFIGEELLVTFDSKMNEIDFIYDIDKHCKRKGECSYDMMDIYNNLYKFHDRIIDSIFEELKKSKKVS